MEEKTAPPPEPWLPAVEAAGGGRAGARHRGPVARLAALGAGRGVYLSAGQDGALRAWRAGQDGALEPVQAEAVGRAWLTDAVALRAAGLGDLVAVAGLDRAISFFRVVQGKRHYPGQEGEEPDGGGSGDDDAGGHFQEQQGGGPRRPPRVLEPAGRVALGGALGPALCLAAVPGPGTGTDLLAWGDASGAVRLLDPAALLKAGSVAAASLTEAAAPPLHAEPHGGWVTALLHLPGEGLLSASLDGTLRLADARAGGARAAGADVAAATPHRRGVRCVAAWPRRGLVASAGAEPLVALWRVVSGALVPAGELAGEEITSGVLGLAAADEGGGASLFVLAGDGGVSLWEVEARRCEQRLAAGGGPGAKPGALCYDACRAQLVTATHKPTLWRRGGGGGEGGAHTGRAPTAAAAQAAPRTELEVTAALEAASEAVRALRAAGDACRAAREWDAPPVWLAPWSSLPARALLGGGAVAAQGGTTAGGAD